METMFTRFKRQSAKAYKTLDGIFTDKEAWALFRGAAFVETIGWTMLIIGILFSHFKWPWHDAILAVFGSIHGMLFIYYIFIVFFGHRSLGWGVWRFLVAELVSVLPYGALVFEQWVAYERRTETQTSSNSSGV